MECLDLASDLGRDRRSPRALARHAELVADAELAAYRNRFGRFLQSRLPPDALEREWRSYWEMQRQRVIIATQAAERIRPCPRSDAPGAREQDEVSLVEMAV